MKNKWKNRRFKRSITGLFIDYQERLWVSSPKNKFDKDKKGLKFDIFNSEGIYQFTTFLDIPVKSDFLFNGDVHFIGNRIYLFDFNKCIVECYKYKEFE